MKFMKAIKWKLVVAFLLCVSVFEHKSFFLSYFLTVTRNAQKTSFIFEVQKRV